MGIQTRNLDDKSPLKRRTFTVVLPDKETADADVFTGSAAPILFGYPEPDSTKEDNVFIVDKVEILCAAKPTSTAASVELDINYDGFTSTSMMTTKPKVTQAATAPGHSKDGGTGETAAVIDTDKHEIAAGVPLVGELTVANSGGTVTGFGAITLVVEGYYKDEF